MTDPRHTSTGLHESSGCCADTKTSSVAGHLNHLQVPLHYESDYSYPLVVWLSQNAKKRQELTEFAKSLSLRNYVITAPFLTSALIRGAHSPAASTELATAINCSIQHAMQKMRIHPQRIFVVAEQDFLPATLNSMPLIHDRISGIASLLRSSQLPNPPCSSLSGLHPIPPLFFCLSELGSHLKDEIEQPWRLFHSLGYKVRFKTIAPGSGFQHSALRNIDRWIMEAVTGQPALDPEDLVEPEFCFN